MQPMVLTGIGKTRPNQSDAGLLPPRRYDGLHQRHDRVVAMSLSGFKICKLVEQI